MQDRVEELKQALVILKDLKISEALQKTALEYLLSAGPSSKIQKPLVAPSTTISSETGDLRAFITSAKPKGAVSEIPTLLYWAKQNEGKDSASEKDVVELYRRAGIRPPKDVMQSFRDLCSKKYMRLEAVEGERGCVRLARAGEDFVLHDLLAKPS